MGRSEGRRIVKGIDGEEGKGRSKRQEGFKGVNREEGMRRSERQSDCKGGRWGGGNGEE